VNAFKEAECDAFRATDIDRDQPVTPLQSNAVHQHFVADIAFKVRANGADCGIDFRDECSVFFIHSCQKSVSCGDVCFSADWHGEGFITAGTIGLSMVESAHGDDFLSFMDVAAAGQGRPCKGAYGDLLRESELPGM